MVSDRTRVTRQEVTLAEDLREDNDTTARKLEQTDRESGQLDLSGVDELFHHIGKYECRSLLGKGGMGAVYLCFDPLIEREVAIKVLPKAMSQDETAIRRFMAEARAIGQLSHPHVIAIYDIGKHEDHFFIVTELARGGSVSALLKQPGRIPLEEACRIALEAAEGLQAAHRAGLVHRDIKPDNLMFADDRQVKLVDFGLAKAIARSDDLSMTATGQILGTPLYMAPEQIEKGEIDARTDIYSLGATFCHLLTSQPPFVADSITRVLFAHVGGPRPDPCKVDPSLPAACTQIIARAMAIEPDERYQDMGEFIAEVKSLLAEDRGALSDDTATVALTQPLKSPRVIIVEPSSLLSRVTGEVFEQAGCASIIREDAADAALARADNQPIDVAVSSRQLVGNQGQQLLRSIRDSSTASQVVCVLTTSGELSEMIAESTLLHPCAYVRKQAPPEELLRAAFVCTDRQLRLPSGSNPSELSVTVLSNDGMVPAVLGAWLGELGVADVSAHSIADLANDSLQDRDLIIWIDQSPASEQEIAARLLGSAAQQVGGVGTTVAMIRPEESQWRLRAVKRSAFLASCECRLDRDRLSRLLAITTHGAGSV